MNFRMNVERGSSVANSNEGTPPPMLEVQCDYPRLKECQNDNSKLIQKRCTSQRYAAQQWSA